MFGFVKQSLGTVRLHSVVGQGSTVTLVLPTVAAPDGAGLAAASGGPADLPEPAAQALPAGLRVLLVEDQADVRRTVLRTLRALGCRVTAMATAEQALAHLGAHAAPDLLLSDVALGAGLSGAALARLARQRWPAMARLLMSGHVHDAQNAVHTGSSGDALLRKPFGRASLLAAMRCALAAVADAAPAAPSASPSAALSAARPPPPAG